MIISIITYMLYIYIIFIIIPEAAIWINLSFYNSYIQHWQMAGGINYDNGFHNVNEMLIK